MTLWKALTSEYEMRPPGDSVHSVGSRSMTASESLCPVVSYTFNVSIPGLLSLTLVIGAVPE